MHPHLDNRLRAKLRLRHIELLDALGDTLNIHRAAPRINLSQPSTSKLLQEIEEIYGTRLFDRLPRGLRATTAGEAAIRAALGRQAANHLGVRTADEQRRVGDIQAARGRIIFGAERALVDVELAG